MNQRGTSAVFVISFIVVMIMVYLAFSISQSPTSEATPTSEIPAANINEIVVITSKDTHQIGEDVEVTIKNNTEESIASLNFKFDCSIVTLEYKSDGWKPVEDRCFLRIPTVSVVIKPGEGHTVLLPTKDLESGTYRVKLDYTPGEDAFVKRMSLTAYSEEFQIIAPQQKN